jgi:pentatricopeptide repeat protein
MYAKCGVLSKAQQVLKELHVRNVVSWNALITGYAEHGQGHEAVNSFDQMQSEGLAPDDVTYMCVLKACGGIGAVEKGKQIHNEIINRRLLETDIDKDIVLGTALVDMYAKCGELVKAQKLHEELRIRNVISWSALIAGYVQQGQCHEALNCFERMQSEGLPPNEVTFICMLKACGNTGAVNKGKRIHNEILCGGFFSKDVAIGNVLVDMYAKCGVLRQAQKVLEELPVRSVVSWNALISGYAQEGRGHEALNCFWRMQSEGFRPDEITCLCVLSACSHSGLTDDAQMLFGSMTRRYGIVPNLEHHTCMVVIFGFSGRFDMAMQVIRAMPSSDYPAVWLALLGGCRKWGNVKLGILAFDQAVQLDDTCAVVYVLMAEIFAAAGMQKDAEKIEAMRLKATNCKDPGSNLWIDAGGNVSLCFPPGVTGALCK